MARHDYAVKDCKIMGNLAQIRRVDGATSRDSLGHYFKEVEGVRFFGYLGHFTGAYTCYTCGALCDCEEEE